MRHVRSVLLGLASLALLTPANAPGQALTISGGLDLRALFPEGSEPTLVLQGLFLNARKVFRDDLGDRWIVVAQGDADDNFTEVRPYQLYLQYKGPLGRWNVRAGHYLVPFGLLAEYDTERLVLTAVEEENTGLKLDTGIQALGFAGAWDWATSVSTGAGRRWPGEGEGTYLLTARAGHGSDEWRMGFSVLLGTVWAGDGFHDPGVTVRERKMALDLTHLGGRWTARAEVSPGTEDGRWVASAVALPSFAVRPWLDIDGRYALAARSDTRHELGIGATFRAWRGWVLRPAAILELSPDGTTHEFIAQLYYDFSKSY